MIRFLFRSLATLCLAVAVIMAVVDATRSIASSSLVTTPLLSSWSAASPRTLSGFQNVVTAYLPPVIWDPVTVGLLRLPGFLIFIGLALLFYAVGRTPREGIDRFAPEA